MGFVIVVSNHMVFAYILRVVYPNNTVSSHLIATKSRIAPPKPLLLSQLLQKIPIIFKDKFPISNINLWSDSQIALARISSHPYRWSVFVSNRVSEIQQLTETWRYITSADNPG